MVPSELADRVVAAIEAGDAARLESLFSDDLVVYANFLGRTNDRRRTLAILAWMHANVRDLRYEIVTRVDTGEGYVQQHVLRGVAPDGTEIVAPACHVVTVRDGRVARIDEYLDSAHVAALLP